MSVNVRKRKGRWLVDVWVKRADDGRLVRDRHVVGGSRLQARNWGLERERALLDGGGKAEKVVVMTVEDFAPRFVAGHLKANLNKRSAIETAENILRVHLVPFIGKLTLDRVSDDVVADLKGLWVAGGYKTPKRTIRGTNARKSLNNRLSILNSMLKIAVEWKSKTGLTHMPCTVRLLKVDNQRTPNFYDHADYERLVEGARAVDPRVYALVLLAGDGGLRMGECIGLNLSDVDFRNARMTIRRSVYVSKGEHYVDDVKGLLAKPVPIGHGRLLDALKACRHLRGERVLYQDDGEELTPRIVRMWIERAEKKAGLPVTGRIHIMRHTFCSHSAMAGVPARTIQGLARHATLASTLPYMHLSPSALDEGMEMLVRSREAGGGVVVRAGGK